MTPPQPFKLIIEDDEGRRSIVPVDLGDVTLGRHEGNVIRLKERNVSRRHARLAVEDDGRIFVYDLDSYNGLWANGDRINGRFELHQGDLLRIGDFQLELKGDSLKPRREEATQRTRVQDVQGTPDSHTEPEISAPEPTQVDADVPPAPPTEPLHDGHVAPEPTITAVTALPQPPDEGPSLHAIMEEATALIRNPVTHAPSDEPVPDAALQPPFAKLLCLTTQLAGREFAIEHGETVIGRTEDNEIAIDHRSISRHHAKVLVSEGRFRLVDLDSANGTLVNGEVYARAELKRGDILELGHVRLRFVPPGETATWTVDEQNQLARMEAQRRARGKLWRNSPVVLFLLVGSAIVGLSPLFLNVFGRRGPAVAPNPNARIEHSAASVAETQAQEQNRESVDRLLVAARHAAQQHQFKKVESLAQEVLQLEPGCDEAQAMLRLCAMEKKSQTALDNATQAAQGSRWSEAYNQLQDVSKESSVARLAQSLLAQVKPGVIDERLVDCKQAIQKEDWDEAELLLEEMTGLDAARTELPELKTAIRDGRAKHPGANHTGRATQKSSRKDKTQDKDGLKDAGKQSSSAARAAQGSMGTPAVAAAPTSTQPPTTSPAVASRPPPGRDPKAMYAEGTKLLAAKQYTRAIEEFQKCVSADKNFAMCYRALGIAHADANNGAEAVRYYRLYLKVDPSARDAAQVRTLLQQWDQTQAAQGQQAP